MEYKLKGILKGIREKRTITTSDMPALVSPYEIILTKIIIQDGCHIINYQIFGDISEKFIGKKFTLYEEVDYHKNDIRKIYQRSRFEHQKSIEITVKLSS